MKSFLIAKGFTVQISHRVKYIGLCVLFFGLALNAIGLIFYSASAAKSKTTEVALNQNAISAPVTAVAPPLQIMDLPSAANTGACMAWEHFGHGAQGFSMAKALLLTGPLKNKSWALEATSSTDWEAKASVTDKLGDILGQMKLPAPDRRSGQSLVWVVSSETEARALVNQLKDKGANASAQKVANTSLSQRLALLPQGPVEVAYTRSLIERMPDSELSAVACPEAAKPLLVSAGNGK